MAKYSSQGTNSFGLTKSAKWDVGGFSTILTQEAAPFGIKVTTLELGGIKTDWAGPSMKVPPISELYKQTVGVFAEMIKKSSGHEPSIPSKVAAIVVKLSESKEAPVRLLVGPDAVEYGKLIEQLYFQEIQSMRN